MDQKELVTSISEGVTKGFLSFSKDFLKSFFSLNKKKYRNKKNLIGITIAFNTLNEEEFEKLNIALIRPLNEYLFRKGFGSNSNVIVLDRKDAQKIQNRKDAEEHIYENNSHIILYGSLFLGNKDGEKKYVYRLNGVVRHSVVKKEFSDELSRQFRTILPELNFFSAEDDIVGFDFASQHISYVISYVIAYAAILSKDIYLSKKILNNLVNEMDEIKDIDLINPLNKLRHFVVKTFSDVLFIELIYANDKFLHSRDVQHILSKKRELGLLNKLGANNHHIALFRSIYLFFNKKFDSAIQELKRFENSDILIKYSLGFLYAFQGEIDKALENYKKTHYNPERIGRTLIDIEIFISEVIEKYPEKIQLYFFRGLINYKQKNDFALAKKDFLFFKNDKKSKNYPRLLELTDRYLKNMK